MNRRVFNKTGAGGLALLFTRRVCGPEVSMHSFHPAQIVIRAGLETDYPFVRVRYRVEELIELALSHFLLARLRVLDDEHHPQGNRGDERLELSRAGSETRRRC